MANESPDQEDQAASAAVEEALDAFRDLLTPEDVEESRELLLDVLAAHPVGRLLAERVRERKRPMNSCEHPTMGAPASSASDALARGKGKATGGSR